MRICIRIDNVFFLKSSRPSLPLKKAPHLLPSLSLAEERGCNRLPVLETASLYCWRGIKALRQVVRDGTAGE